MHLNWSFEFFSSVNKIFSAMNKNNTDVFIQKSKFYKCFMCLIRASIFTSAFISYIITRIIYLFTTMFMMLIRKKFNSSVSDYCTNKGERGSRDRREEVHKRKRKKHRREEKTPECAEQKFPSLRCHRQPPRVSQRSERGVWQRQKAGATWLERVNRYESCL